MRRILVVSISALLVWGCGAGPETETEVAGLNLTVQDGMVMGTFTHEGQVVRLESVQVEPGIFDVVVEVNGMILDGAVDRSAGVVASLDGYSEQGEDTQMTEQDRVLLKAAYRAVDEAYDTEAPEAVVTLRRALSYWSMVPETMELTQTVMGEEGRGITMLCSYANCGSWSGSCTYWNWYSYATHDCCYGGLWGIGGDCTDRYDGDTSQIVQLGDHYSCSGDTWVWTGSGWACGEPDHWTRPYEVGGCWGRCGEGCGSDHAYTKDCTDHDGCVRNGHTITSSWCSDELSSVADDLLSASNCY